MASGRGRLVRMAGGLAVAVLSVAGCVSMPSSGPPTSLQVNQNDAQQSQDYVGPFPQGPEAGWNPEQIVDGFLFANASYYTASDIVREYLTPQTQQTWNPSGSVTVFQAFTVAPSPPTSAGHGDQQAMVTISGQVQAALNGSGQQLYSSVAQGNGASAQPSASSGAPCPQTSGQNCSFSFTLVKVSGQWRIANAPPYLLLDETSFARAWEPQDLYFFNSSRQVLVPDSVFVPIGTSETDLLNKLANALRNGPRNWLADATANVFPPHITSVSVTVESPTAVVNLKGTVTKADQAALKYVGAELVSTLTSASASLPAITGIQLDVNDAPLEVNGAPWELLLNSAAAYDPYPSEPASFTFLDDEGVPQLLCGSAQNSEIGTPVPLFGQSRGGRVTSCGTSSAAAASPAATPSPTSSATTKPGGSRKPGHSAKAGQKSPASTLSMVAVSPDGSYVAEVSAGRNQLSIGSLRGHAGLKSVTGPDSDITSISWDRQDNLWLSQDGSVWVVSPSGKATQTTFPDAVSALSVAPDGVRVAMIVQAQGSPGNQLVLAAINPAGSQNGQPASHGTGAGGPSIGSPTVPLGPGITNSVALAWHDADNLIVLGPPGTTNQLQVVPISGRAATQSLAPPQTPSGVTVTSVAAGNQANVVVVGLSNGQLEVSDGYEGPWQSVGRGTQPGYVIPLATTK